jgi:rod shape-determining protein MreC
VIKLKSKKLTACLIFLFIALLTAALVPHFRSPFISILKYPLKVFSFINREIGAIVFYHRNYTQNIKLNKEIGILRQHLIQTQELYLENQRLKDILAFRQNSPHRFIACRVIGRDPASWSSMVVIDKGKDSGLKADMAVLTHAGLVGRVEQVGGSTSKVMLLNDPNMSVSAIVQRSRQEGLICGTWQSNSLIMRYLSADADIKSGDVVITSGLSPVYPKGILVGVVKDVGVEFSGLSLYATVIPMVQLSAIEEVLVVVK